jgi:hypothetical protein
MSLKFLECKLVHTTKVPVNTQGGLRAAHYNPSVVAAMRSLLS